MAIYLDYAATTPLRPEVLEVMLPWLTEKYANPSGFYCASREARDAIEGARAAIAETIGAHIDELNARLEQRGYTRKKRRTGFLRFFSLAFFEFSGDSSASAGFSISTGTDSLAL